MSSGAEYTTGSSYRNPLHKGDARQTNMFIISGTNNIIPVFRLNLISKARDIIMSQLYKPGIVK